MRAFFASTLPDDLHKALARQIEALKSFVPDGSVRWVSPDNIHLTLKFLGEITPEQAKSVVDAAKTAASAKPAFDLSATGLGMFPNPHRPSVIWVGVAEANRNLAALQALLESKLSEVGFKPEGRPFHPHLTLGRVRRDLNRSAQSALAKSLSPVEVGELGRWRVESLTLMKSDLRPGGPRYTEVARLPLGSDPRS